MAITSSGVGSGIDIRSLVDDLLRSEGEAKTQKYDADEATALSKITGFGTLKGSLSDFQSSLKSLSSLSSFAKRSASSSDTDVFEAVAQDTATAGSYSIEVTQLATNHKLSSKDFSGKDAVIGTGTLTFGFGSETFSINIGQDNQTLSGIASRINETAVDTGVSASIVTVDSGTRLVLSSTQTGVDSAFTVSVTSDADGDDADDAGLSQLISANLTTTASAQSATVLIDGALVTSNSNTVEGAIDGVSIDLIKANVGDPKTLTVSLDQNAATASVNQFVSSYNSVMSSISELTKFEDTGPETTSGVLIGDSLLRNLQSQIRRELNSSIASAVGFGTLAEIGITSNEFTGELEVSNTRLNDALSSDFDGVANLFADSTNGVAKRLDTLVDTYLRSNGLIDARIQGLNSDIAQIGELRIQLERQLQASESRYLSQFIAMDTLIAQLNNTSSFLSEQLAALPEPLSFRK